MRLALTILSPLLALLLTAHGVSATPSPTTTNVRLGRFVLGGQFAAGKPLVKRNLSTTEVHARELTRRKPTRRSTAQRRQTSDLPPEPNNVEARATVGGLAIGELRLSGSGPSIGTDGVSVSLQFLASPSWTSRTDQRIEVLTPELSSLPYLGFSYTSYAMSPDPAERPGYLGPSERGAALLTMAASATPPGSTPQDVAHYYGTSSVGLETDVWTINYLTSELSVQWTNPDGSKVPVYIVTNGATTYITGNPSNMHPNYGTGFAVIQMYGNSI